jgi:hypothetical protein
LDQFVDARERLPYLVVFLGTLLTAFGSAYYHLAPDNGFWILRMLQKRQPIAGH